MEIKLLPASVDMPTTSQVNAEYMGLVPTNRLAVATWTIKNNDDAAYPSDSFGWSASAGEDGTFNFYATPLKNSWDGDVSSQLSSFLPWQGYDARANVQNAVFQYALHASMPSPISRQSLNVYA
jgi:hypothetical protein